MTARNRTFRRPLPGVSCTPGFLLTAAALVYLDGQELALCWALACALHELGHWAVLRLLGGRVRALRLTAVGAEMKLDAALSYGREAAAALAGPAVSLAAALLCAGGGRNLLAGLNFCAGLFNLLPILPLDGGRALYFALSARSLRLADGVLRLVSAVLSGALLGLGWAVWRALGNPTLLCTAAWLMAGALRNFKETLI